MHVRFGSTDCVPICGGLRTIVVQKVLVGLVPEEGHHIIRIRGDDPGRERGWNISEAWRGLLGTLRAALWLRVLVHRDHGRGGERRRGSRAPQVQGPLPFEGHRLKPLESPNRARDLQIFGDRDRLIKGREGTIPIRGVVQFLNSYALEEPLRPDLGNCVHTWACHRGGGGEVGRTVPLLLFQALSACSTLLLALLRPAALRRRCLSLKGRRGALPLDRGEFVGALGIVVYPLHLESIPMPLDDGPGVCPCQGCDCTAYEG